MTAHNTSVMTIAPRSAETSRIHGSGPHGVHGAREGVWEEEVGTGPPLLPLSDNDGGRQQTWVGQDSIDERDRPVMGGNPKFVARDQPNR
ncbi:hypothetical protein [Streptomyces chartreusis]